MWCTMPRVMITHMLAYMWSALLTCMSALSVHGRTLDHAHFFPLYIPTHLIIYWHFICFLRPPWCVVCACEDGIQRSACRNWFSSITVGLSDWTQVTWIGSRCLYLSGITNHNRVCNFLFLFSQRKDDSQEIYFSFEERNSIFFSDCVLLCVLPSNFLCVISFEVLVILICILNV